MQVGGGVVASTRLLTFYLNHPGGNLVHKHQTIKFDPERERSAQSTSNSAEQTKRSERIASPLITAHVF